MAGPPGPGQKRAANYTEIACQKKRLESLDQASQRMPGGSRPPNARIIRPIPPLPAMAFIIFCICRKFLSSRLTSDTWVPEPAAIRRLREPSMFFG